MNSASEGTNDIQRLSADDQMAGFAQTAFVPRLFLALVVHVVVLGVGSIPFFMGLANPPPQTQTPTAPTSSDATSPEKAPSADGATTTEATPTSTTDPANPESTPKTNVDPTADPTADPRLKNKAYVGELNEAAKPAEIPKQPEKDLLDDLDNLP